VQRIVISSSCSAVIHFTEERITVSEANWNDVMVTECEEKGKDASAMAKYAASKTLAERCTLFIFHQRATILTVFLVAWNFYEKYKSEVNWDISILNPPWIFGVCQKLYYFL
jgi:nucleoside-diphosphate-sugar epimerase